MTGAQLVLLFGLLNPVRTKLPMLAGQLIIDAVISMPFVGAVLA